MSWKFWEFRPKLEAKPLDGFADCYYRRITKAFYDGKDEASAFREVARILGELKEQSIQK